MPKLTDEKSLDIVLDVKVKVTVQLGSVLLPMREVLELAPGSVLKLAQHASDPVGLFVNDRNPKRTDASPTFFPCFFASAPSTRSRTMSNLHPA